MKKSPSQDPTLTHFLTEDWSDFTPAQKQYWKSLRKQVTEAEKYFWGNNELAPKQGAREPGCPKNTVRTTTPRSLTYDPAKKFANRRRR